MSGPAASSEDLGRLCMDGNANLALRHLSSLSAEEAKSAVQSVDVDGRTPLHWAVSSRSFTRDSLRSLLNYGAEVSSVDKGSGWTALHIATSASHADAVDELLYHGAEVNAKTPKGLTPLHYAASKGLTDIGRALLKAGALVNARDNAKQCPIHRAASNGHDAFIRMLGKPPARADGTAHEKTRVNPADRLGNTPLHLALESAHGNTAVILVEELGADRSRINEDGLTAEQMEGVGGQEQKRVLDYFRSSVGVED
ncbi:ankyrin [Ceraceosorus guamensis]|uniref:Ankyrin n=1 Tax=Ceraceosorus guamensis TaxID=1522189 RepID=A0A316VU23_9BASI|nr:ankyrin [Ceraceosorus guamensis]PWN41097.1 ankyrin [Ceraceosorus guamensis]